MLVDISKHLPVIKKYGDDLLESGDLGFYKNRNQEDLAKIRYDHIIGKAGEFGVYEYLLSKNRACTVPDTERYAPEDKNYGADLLSKKTRLHVKSQSRKLYLDLAKKFGDRGPSWTFQKSGIGPYNRDPILDDPEGYFVGCLVDWHNRCVSIKVIAECKKIVQLLEPPYLARLANKKAVLYMDTVIKNLDWL